MIEDNGEANKPLPNTGKKKHAGGFRVPNPPSSKSKNTQTGWHEDFILDGTRLFDYISLCLSVISLSFW